MNVPETLGVILFHPDHEQPGPLLTTIAYVRQALEFLELRYQQVSRRAPEQEPAAAPPARKQAARKQATGQGRGRPRKANGAAEPPPADPPLFPTPEPDVHAA